MYVLHNPCARFFLSLLLSQSRLTLLLTALCTALASTNAPAASNGTVNQPVSANLEITPPGVEAVSLIEHFPYTNLISWEIIVQNGRCAAGMCEKGPNAGMSCSTFSDCSEPLTYTGGAAEIFDQHGVSMDSLNFSPGRFENVARFWGRGLDYIQLSKLGMCNVDPSMLCANAGGDDADNCDPDGSLGNAACDARPGPGFIPAGGRVGIPFPLEKIGHNVVPASSQMQLCFEEFGNSAGNCNNPLEVLDVALEEYRAPQAYIFPLGNPDDVECLDDKGNPNTETPYVFMGRGAGHEINSNHRFARNQRYAYDVGVRCGTRDRKNLSDTNDDWYIYRQPVLAQASGSVVVYEGGHPENDMPPDAVFSDTCRTRRCDGLIPDECTLNPLVIPGSGNQLVLLHPDSGERTNYTHMVATSNDMFMCGASAVQGEQVGEVGNSGSSSAPHIHFSTLTSDGPEDQTIGIDTSNWPNYWTNVVFSSAETWPPDPGLPPQSYTPRRQLDVGMPSVPNGLQWEMLPIPAPLPRNSAVIASEQEPNNTLDEHNSLVLPATVSGMLENANVGDLAVRGDAIEDVYRIDLAMSDELRIDLAEVNTGENLDIYALTEDLRVINPTHEGTSPSGVERMCLNLDAGAYYLMVSNVDFTTSQDAPYELSVVSDLQSIQVSIEDGAANIAVDDSCQAIIEFSIALHDNCCLDASKIDQLIITPSITTSNAIADAAVIDSVNVMSERDITVNGHVRVSDLTSCPAQLRVDAEWQDCSGNVFSTLFDGGEDTIDVLDTTPPVVTSSVGISRLWPPEHELIDVGFARVATDNCDAGISTALATEVWGDESETAVMGTGNFAPDAKDPDGALRLRAERLGSADGRIYLMTSSATDACGNSGFACSTVGVPSSSSEEAAAELEAQENSALQYCNFNNAPPPGFFQHGIAAEVGPKQ